MIVYRASTRPVRPRGMLRALAALAREGGASHDAARELLIECGVAEAAIADALCPEADAESEVLRALRDATLAAARALLAAWNGAGEHVVRALAARAADALEHLEAHELPDGARAGEPEGYAFYAHYPEQHLEAARALARARAPRRAVCIGVRGIGTSLSAVVAAALEETGCETWTCTVRPRGHPFDRRVALAPSLERALRARADALFIVADEGPGLSGSSFASVAEALSALGVPDERIVLLPSWVPDGSAFVSERARRQWARHEKFAADFDALWIASGRLARALGAEAPLVDLSGGAWRARWIPDRARWPAVQPQHERRKYLVMCDGAELLVKFVGLGPRGRMAYERAERVAGAGFAPAPLVLAHGFLAAQVVRGTPLGGEALGDTDLERVSTYLACVAREFPAGGEAEPGPLAEMLECNVAEALGADARRCVARLASEPALRDAAAVALDARMLAHEWLRVGVGLVKTDATDHHDDHFFPGPGDLAWDVAGAAVELDLAPAAVRRLVERVAALSGDASLARRVPFHTAVYAAFRLGYAMLAADALRGSEEEPRWRALVPRYRDVLRQVLARGAHAA